MPVLHSRRAKALAAGTAALAVAGLAISGAPAASAAPAGTTTIQNTLPTWLSHATRNAVTPNVAGAQQTVKVYLAPNGGLAALQAKVTSLSTPGSADYRKWLTTAQYNATYAPTKASADAVSAYLTSKGLQVTGVEAHRRYVSASGTKLQLDSAFGVTLGSYTHDGQTVTAPSTAVTLPTAVGADVLTVSGLDTTVITKSGQHIVESPAVTPAAKPAAVTPGATPPPAGFRNARPCAINYGNPLATTAADYTTPLPKFLGQTLSYAPCGYTGPSYRSAYEVASPETGAGVTVAITDAYAWQYIAQDANTYAVNHGDGSYTKGQLTQSFPAQYTNQELCDPTGWSGEETLDVEAVHAMAPNANIKYYASASCLDDDFTQTLARVVDDNKAQLVTNSWAGNEADESGPTVAAYEQVFLQGATQGISFLFSSGDDGDNLAATGLKQVSYPSSDPYVTGAGGTSTAIAYGTTTFQTGWGTHNYSLINNGTRWADTGFLYGAGGGYSALFNRPSYQTAKVIGGSGRAVPDVAMDADPNTGMLIGQTQSFPEGVHYDEYRIGGTSLASPLLAGFFALAVQNAGGGFGLLNPLLYSSRTGTINDVKPVPVKGDVRVNYNNGLDPTDGISYFVRTFNQDSSLPTTRGWDPVTGLGVPNPAFIASVAAAPSKK